MPHSRPSCSRDTPAASAEGCAVCGDMVKWNRYGAPTCLGCMVFFRRAINNNSEFKCPRNGLCEIVLNSRRACRSCRLQKCHQVGMKPESE
ncbi:hypothetical protein PENTCL1PPCAC_29845 [Pristionchus entomophagus]|uniref:Nuclear receptor domain-containing protein n=1 Tax=Pristionchus entomophagus TaxID=358040 RepID=A0AAV5UMN7_9BILA|nr:hypothetical protein PENTCL1PPCAC_29845 [Pristionchus entomophagus]